jgi:hypothetical protein
MRTIMAGLAEFERDLIRERVKSLAVTSVGPPAVDCIAAVQMLVHLVPRP